MIGRLPATGGCKGKNENGMNISYRSLNTVADGVLLVVPDAQKLTSGRDYRQRGNKNFYCVCAIRTSLSPAEPKWDW